MIQALIVMIDRSIPLSVESVAGAILLALFLGWAFVPEDALAQRKAGRNGAVFLEIATGAREAALGSAATSVRGDASHVFWNPAGTVLADDETASATLSYSDWLAGLEYSTLGVGYNTGYGTVTIGVEACGISDVTANRENGFEEPAIQELVTDNETSDTYNYLDLAISGAYSRTFLDRVSVGATVKYVRESIDGVSASAVAFDFGTVYEVGVQGWQIGARINNLGTDVKFYNQSNPLPLSFSIGSSFYPVNSDEFRLMLSADAVKPQDSQQLIYGGTEVSFYDLLFLRGGYKFNYSASEDDGTTARGPVETSIENFNVGAGIQQNISDVNLKIDYAYGDVDLLEGTHRITLNIVY
ncbi:hypothetical protein BRC21_01240 [Candidatus Saccharibacteria bacterium SW_7_54_9]|nr:MAG: hypothetical protein BRC21_01240 [Candidatus Saccharibacteria bacterium SW_7_54_9]